MADGRDTQELDSTRLANSLKGKGDSADNTVALTRGSAGDAPSETNENMLFCYSVCVPVQVRSGRILCSFSTEEVYND